MNATLYMRKEDEENADLGIKVRVNEEKDVHVDFQQNVAEFVQDRRTKKINSKYKDQRWLYVRNELSVLLSRERLLELRDKIDAALAELEAPEETTIEGEWSEVEQR